MHTEQARRESQVVETTNFAQSLPLWGWKKIYRGVDVTYH